MFFVSSLQSAQKGQDQAKTNTVFNFKLYFLSLQNLVTFSFLSHLKLTLSPVLFVLLIQRISG